MPAMSKKRGRPKAGGRKSPHMVRIREDLYQLMRSLADRENRPLTREINQALTLYLQTRGLLPGGGAAE